MSHLDSLLSCYVRRGSATGETTVALCDEVTRCTTLDYRYIATRSRSPPILHYVCSVCTDSLFMHSLIHTSRTLIARAACTKA